MATAAAANESRGDILAWINDLLQLNVSKIESAGTGAILCQIMDSIYGDVALHKVKFNTVQEYEYVNNFKVLQACFTAHGIDKTIPVERLIKLRFQDNLEFLQWMKKFWDANYPGGVYDAVGRRKGAASTSTVPIAAAAGKSRPTASRIGSLCSAAAGHATGNPAAAHGISSTTPPATPSNQSIGQLQQTIQQLNRSLTELRLTVDEMERERDFYFGKLRDIEVVTQSTTDPVVLDSSLFRQITEILYKTEEGFVLPETAANQPTTAVPISNSTAI